MEKVTNGYIDIPNGKLAAVVTSLEMTSSPHLKPSPLIQGWSILPVFNPKAGWYKRLFRRVGEHWLWVSRLEMSDDKLQAIISDPDVSIFVLRKQDQEEGLLELDFRVNEECELTFMGITPDYIGKGLGKVLMEQAIMTVWSRPIKRFWVHTCTLDGPSALPFYIRSGFKPIKFQVEVFDDPRITGLYPTSAATHVPLLVR